jgi:multimeric flavodoxin WrbA
VKKVTAFIGTARRKATFRAVQEFEQNLKQLADVEFEYVFLSDYNLEFCRGCRLCTDRGEEKCPLKDDRDVLIEKMDNADGVIFASPTYSFQVTARMKNLMDRLAFVCHRPRFFGKTCTAIVTQAFYGGPATRKYLEFTAGTFGFTITNGSSVTTLDPMTARQQEAISREMRASAQRFYRGLMRPTPPAPSLLRLVLFRLSRTSVKLLLDDSCCDYRVYRDKGWFESDYYFDTSLGPVKKLVGHLSDLWGRRQATQR